MAFLQQIVKWIVCRKTYPKRIVSLHPEGGAGKEEEEGVGATEKLPNTRLDTTYRTVNSVLHVSVLKVAENG